MATEMKPGVVALQRMGGLLYLTSPYNPGILPFLKALKGRWKPELKQWVFDPVYENDLRGLCLTWFGAALPTLDKVGDASVSMEVMTKVFHSAAGKKKPKPITVEEEKEARTRDGITKRERAFMFARDLAELMVELSEIEREAIFDIIFKPATN